MKEFLSKFRKEGFCTLSHVKFNNNSFNKIYDDFDEIILLKDCFRGLDVIVNEFIHDRLDNGTGKSAKFSNIENFHKELNIKTYAYELYPGLFEYLNLS